MRRALQQSLCSFPSSGTFLILYDQNFRKPCRPTTHDAKQYSKDDKKDDEEDLLYLRSSNMLLHTFP